MDAQFVIYPRDQWHSHFCCYPLQLQIVIVKELARNWEFVDQYIDVWFSIENGEPLVDNENFNTFYHIALNSQLHRVLLGVSRDRCLAEWLNFFSFNEDLRKRVIEYMTDCNDLDNMEDDSYKERAVRTLVHEYFELKALTNE